MAVLRILVDLIRGALIGVVEVIPGVSGGTIALIVGVYERLITSAGHLVRGVVSVVRRRPEAAREHLAQVAWRTVIPVLIGMAAAVVVAAAVVAPLIEEHPVETRGLFLGLILASLVVPIRMVGRWRAREVVLAVLAAVLAFVLTGLPAAAAYDPPLWLVAIAAAVAVCALVLPGVSGSYLLLVVGLYGPTLAALNARDLAYIGVFAAGAIVGLAAFVPLLQWLLEHRRHVTLAIATGLMAGAARALWPWQDADGTATAPTGDALPILGLVALGIVVVAALLVVESVLVRRRVATGDDVLHPDDSDGLAADPETR